MPETTQVDAHESASDEGLDLVEIGSPEDGFAGAGTVWPLAGVSAVHFVRGDERARRGGADEIELAIALRWVSARHATLELDPGSAGVATIIDRGSRNGTFVEGIAVAQSQNVRPGDVFEVGRSFWMLVPAGPEPSPEDLDHSAHPRLRAIDRALGRLATSNVPVLLVGETGTGKDRRARRIHAGGRPAGPFVRVNLAAGPIDAQLLESNADGVIPIEHARGGTLVLEEIGELDGCEQTELLSVLLGATPRTWDRPSAPHDVRVVTVGPRDLRSLAIEGRFRPDLLALLAGYEAHLPPLRERREDLGALAREYARRSDGAAVPMTVEVFRALLAHSWPFNVRELAHSLRAAATLATSAITLEVWTDVAWHTTATPPRRLESVRRELVHQLGIHAGDLQAVAAALQCEISDVERWLARFHIVPAEFRSAG